MKTLLLLPPILIITACASTSPLRETTDVRTSKNLQNILIAKVTDCFADNHTLINKDKVVSFLQGGGDANGQVMKFLNNSAVQKLGFAANVYGIQLEPSVTYEGKDIKHEYLKRKKHKDTYGYQAGEASLLNWFRTNQCNLIAKKWVWIDEHGEITELEPYT